MLSDTVDFLLSTLRTELSISCSFCCQRFHFANRAGRKLSKKRGENFGSGASPFISTTSHRAAESEVILMRPDLHKNENLKTNATSNGPPDRV